MPNTETELNNIEQGNPMTLEQEASVIIRSVLMFATQWKHQEIEFVAEVAEGLNNILAALQAVNKAKAAKIQ